MAEPLTIIIDGIWRRPGRFKRWQAAFANAGIEAVEHEYDSSGFVAIDALGEQLARRIEHEERDVCLLGFSMGGLVLRAAVRHNPRLPVRRTAFLNTPHTGSWLAFALPLAAIKQMRPNSPFLRSLAEFDWQIPTLAIHSPGDAMVFPGRNARFDRATHSIANYVPAHMWPVYSPSLRRRVVDFLAGVESAVDINSKKVVA